jgi:hypothetical protein
MPARLLEIDVLPRLQREECHRRVPVVGRRDRDGIDRLVIERAAEVDDDLRRVRLGPRGLDALRDDARIDVADIRDLCVLELRKVLSMDDATTIHADHRDHDLLVRGPLLRRGEERGNAL